MINSGLILMRVDLLFQFFRVLGSNWISQMHIFPAYLWLPTVDMKRHLFLNRQVYWCLILSHTESTFQDPSIVFRTEVHSSQPSFSSLLSHNTAISLTWSLLGNLSMLLSFLRTGIGPNWLSRLTCTSVLFGPHCHSPRETSDGRVAREHPPLSLHLGGQ